MQQDAAASGELEPNRLLDAQGSAADPLVFCRSNSAGGAALLSRVFGIQGYSSSVHTACASGGQAVGTALKLIRRGEADCVLAGGFDSMINPVGLAGFCLLNAVSPDNDAPERASRPFDASRNGFVLGEGAGFLVLEEWHAARKRGARIYAELAGDGNSLSSYRITDSHPSGDGPIQAMRQAIADAGATLADVNYLNAHGTSTPMNDRSECAAVQAVFGDARGQVAVSSTKSVTGHLIAAAGAVEAAICALSIHHGTLPVNANLREPDPENDLDIVRDAPRTPPRARGAVQLAGLRWLEQLPGLPPPGRRGGAAVKTPRILITGSGAICGSGESPDAILAALLEGRSAIGPITQWDASSWPVGIAAEVADYNAGKLTGDRKLLKHIRRTDVFGLYAADRAIEQAGFAAWRETLDDAGKERFADGTGVIVGSGGGTFGNQYDYLPLIAAAKGELKAFGQELAATVNPLWLLRSLPNNVLGHISIRQGLKGTNACITHHSISGLLALAEATAALRAGECSRAVVAAHDAPIEPQTLLYYHQLGLLSAQGCGPSTRATTAARWAKARRR